MGAESIAAHPRTGNSVLFCGTLLSDRLIAFLTAYVRLESTLQVAACITMIAVGLAMVSGYTT